MDEFKDFPPLMDSPVSCGFPGAVELPKGAALDLNELLVQHPAATFFVRAAGDSMIGAGIAPGDILVVDRALTAAENTIIIASVDNEFTVKYLCRDENGWYLAPDNPAYPEIRFSGEQQIKIFGVVTSCIHQFTGKSRK